MAADEAQDKPEDESVTVGLDEAFAIALCAHREGRYPEAAVVYRQILEVVPEHVDALHFLGVAEHQAGRTQVALTLLDRALALAPEHADALCNRGNVHRSLHRLDEAEADYRKSIGLRPDDPNTLGNLGTVLRARGDLDGAVAAFRAALAKNPEHASTWQNLGDTFEAMQRRSDATAAYQEAARLAPASADMFRNFGFALYAEGRVREAVEMYRRCLALAPDDVRASYLLKACTGEDAPPRAPDDYVRAEFDNFAANFDVKLASLDYRGPALVAEAVRAIAAELPARPIVLDAGCGTGLCGPLLRSLAGRLVGVDLSTGMLDRARARGGYDELVAAELTGFLRGQVGAYDVIVSADTLVYFGDLAEVLAAAAAALRPGGVLVFTLEKADPPVAPSGYRINPHGRYSHTAEYVVRTLTQAGFAPIVAELATRREADAWVPGWLVRARRIAAPAPSRGSRA
jgi:predicted TPR repeat methyltransferase